MQRKSGVSIPRIKCSVDGNMYCLEYRTGRLRWKFESKAAIAGSPVVLDDIVYFGSTDHHVYALFA
jgi:outer membrane protein assembly factor BamB